MSDSIKNYTVEELEEALAAKKKAAAAVREKKKQEYEKHRSRLVLEAMDKAQTIHKALQDYKEWLDHEMELQHERLDEYGAIRSTSKGGFSITDTDGRYRIRRKRQTQPQWDERADKAEDLLRDFFRDIVKKRDAKLAEILMSYLTKNKEGQLKYSSVMKLMQHRDKFNDKRWVEALRLLEESYRSVLSKYYYEFQERDDDDKDWTSLILSLSSI